MPLTRSEWVCLSAGLAVGAVAGANSEKVKALLSKLFELATEGVGQGYAAAIQKVAEQVEGLQDAVAEAKSGGDAAQAASPPPTS